MSGQTFDRSSAEKHIFSPLMGTHCCVTWHHTAVTPVRCPRRRASRNPVSEATRTQLRHGCARRRSSARLSAVAFACRSHLRYNRRGPLTFLRPRIFATLAFRWPVSWMRARTSLRVRGRSRRHLRPYSLNYLRPTRALRHSFLHCLARRCRPRSSARASSQKPAPSRGEQRSLQYRDGSLQINALVRTLRAQSRGCGRGRVTRKGPPTASVAAMEFRVLVG